jgi:hypothetical protein
MGSAACAFSQPESGEGASGVPAHTHSPSDKLRPWRDFVRHISQYDFGTPAPGATSHSRRS